MTRRAAVGRILCAGLFALLGLPGCGSSGNLPDAAAQADARVEPPDGQVLADDRALDRDATLVVDGDAAVVLPLDAAVVLAPDAAVVLLPDAAVVLPPDAAVVLPPDAAVVLPPDAAVVLPPDAAVPPVILRVCAVGGSYASIGAAITAAAAGDTIEVCAGSYLERLVVDGKRLTIRGTAGAAATTLDAAAGGTALLVRGSPGLVFEGFTIRGGLTSQAGGGVRCETSALTLRASIVVANDAGGGGGGLYATGCSLDISATRFDSNRGGNHGGGAWIEGGSGSIVDSQFVLNLASHGAGLMLDRGEVALRRDSFDRNRASVQGGGVWHASNAPIEDCTITDNISDWIAGGIYLADHGPTLSRNTISGNRSFNDGGGLYNHLGPLVMLDSRIAYNYSGDDGGGIRIFTSPARLERNVIERNQAFDSGGGVRVSHLPTLFIDNTFDHNEAVLGGGADLDNDSSVVRGGVFSHNNASRGGAISMGLAPWSGGRIENVRFIANNSNRGALYLADNFEPITLHGLIFEDNTSRRGAGLYASATHFTLENTVFVHNSSSLEGGAIYVGANTEWKGLTGEGPVVCPPCPPLAPQVNVRFVTLYDNHAPMGSALFTLAPAGLSISSAILLGNPVPGVTVGVPVPTLPPAPPPPDPVPPTWRWNDSMPASFTGMADPTGSSGNISADPLFVNASARDFHLTAGSPARDAGDPTQHDADGSAADMGAFGGSP